MTLSKKKNAMETSINKWLYLYVVQGWYGVQYGWEDLTAADDKKEALGYLDDYDTNETAPHRLITRREPNPEHPFWGKD